VHDVALRIVGVLFVITGEAIIFHCNYGKSSAFCVLDAMGWRDRVVAMFIS
jgi:hypothetical protein